MIDVAREHLWIDEVIERRETALEEVHLREGNHVHRDFVQIDVQVSLEPHRARQVIHNIGDDRVLLLEVILFLL